MKLPKVDLFSKKTWIGIAVLIVILFAVMQSCSGKKEPAKPESSSESSETVTAPAVPESYATAERPPAEEPAASSASTVPVAPVAIRVPPSTQELILALGDSNGAVAKEAAVQLINLAAVSELTDAFATGNSKMKERVLWCLRQMNEPVRVFFSEVRSKPMDFHPRVKVAVEEISTALSGGFYQSTIGPVDEPTENSIEKRVLLLRLENQLKEERTTLAELRSKMLQAARNAHTSWVSPGYYWNRQAKSITVRRQYAMECISLKTQITETEGVISLLSDEINNLREEIEILSIM